MTNGRAVKLTDAQKLEITIDHQVIHRILGAVICGRCGMLLTPRTDADWEDIAYARAAHVEELIDALERDE